MTHEELVAHMQSGDYMCSHRWLERAVRSRSTVELEHAHLQEHLDQWDRDRRGDQ